MTRFDIYQINRTTETNRKLAIDYQAKKEEENKMEAYQVIKEAKGIIKQHNGAKRSAWQNGVTAYAFELLASLKEAIDGGYFDSEDIAAPRIVERALLNGADNWKQYSYGGCALIYDVDIAARLCNKSELKKTDNGRKAPNNRETWLDVQARALFQAAALVTSSVASLAE